MIILPNTVGGHLCDGRFEGFDLDSSVGFQHLQRPVKALTNVELAEAYVCAISLFGRSDARTAVFYDELNRRDTLGTLVWTCGVGQDDDFDSDDDSEADDDEDFDDDFDDDSDDDSDDI